MSKSRIEKSCERYPAGSHPQDHRKMSFFTASDEGDAGIQGQENTTDDYPASHDKVPVVVTDTWPSRTFDDFGFGDSIKGKVITFFDSVLRPF